MKLETRNVVNAKIKMLEVSSPASFFDGGVRGHSARHNSGCSSAQCRQHQPSGQRSSYTAAQQRGGGQHSSASSSTETRWHSSAAAAARGGQARGGGRRASAALTTGGGAEDNRC